MAERRKRYANESALVDDLIRRIKSLGGYARKVVAYGPMHSAGEPDIDACLRGRTVKFEAKMPGNKPTAVQYGAMRRWEAVGALVGWGTSLEQLEDLLSHVDDLAWKNPQLVRDEASRIEVA